MPLAKQGSFGRDGVRLLVFAGVVRFILVFGEEFRERLDRAVGVACH